MNVYRMPLKSTLWGFPSPFTTLWMYSAAWAHSYTITEWFWPIYLLIPCVLLIWLSGGYDGGSQILSWMNKKEFW